MIVNEVRKNSGEFFGISATPGRVGEHGTLEHFSLGGGISRTQFKTTEWHGNRNIFIQASYAVIVQGQM